MKFTNGYWRMQDNIESCFAVEFIEADCFEDYMLIYVTTKHIAHRGDTLNIPIFTIKIESPMENIIKVSEIHYKGALDKGPHFGITKKKGDFVIINEEQDFIMFKSGDTAVKIDKKPSSWKMEFIDLKTNKILTESSYRNLGYMKNKETNRNYMVEQLALDVGEYVYGLGERYTPFIKNGQSVEIWNEDGGTASEQTYKNIPFYISNKGYGVFVNDAGDVNFEVGSEKVERVQFSVESEKLEYFVINGGGPRGTIKLYTDLTGKPALPPAWSFGLWLTTSFTTSYGEDTVKSFIQGMENRDIPLHTFHFDCFWMKEYEWCNFKWDNRTFPDPISMLERYKKRGLHICLWINSYIGQKSYMFDEGMKKGYLVKNFDGSVWQCDRWQAGMALVDFTNPEACKWYQDKLEVLIDMGVDCFKTDFGERIPVTGVKYFDGSDTVKMHNYYTYLYNKTVFELLERKLGKNKALVFARSTAAGGQKFPVHWGGDCTATYTSMAEDLRGGLSLALSGYGFWSHDIGGFEKTATSDLYKRWCAFGLLSSHSRLHGSDSYRVPWLFDDEASDVLRKFVKLKATLMPYLFRQAIFAHKEGIPTMRPMFVEFPEDLSCETLDRQYMLGDSLLVAPIFNEDGKAIYYLPKGKWTNYLDNKKYVGERWYTENHDYLSVPLMVKENTILAIGNNKDKPDYDYADGVIFKLYELLEDITAKVEVTNIDSEIVCTATALKNGNKITIQVDGQNDNWSVEAVNYTVSNIEKENDKAIITLAYI
ncbi:MAG: alpha-xylosidase [Lachnospirales bacterium]